ncbi:YtxH domain-containing protein [Jejudonia soesokkakensis]|uniref:YtxH domain-containing protein n=1 Tax=Jejudonia soesokkakensis TaxID=1323432 RepID=A0ABW2MUF8_9FLAO
MKTKQAGGILALLGVAAGAFAFWKYKTMPQEDKDKLHAKINDAGKKIKEGVTDVEETLTEKYNRVKEMASKKADRVA